MSNEEAAAMLQQAIGLYSGKRYPEALDILETLEAMLPENRDIIFQKGLCLAAIQRFDEALDCCTKVKGQFSDSRVEELEDWIVRNANRSSAGAGPQYTSTSPESSETKPQSDAEIPVSAKPPSQTLRCPKCGFENREQSYRCMKCGELLQIAQPGYVGQPPLTGDLLFKLEKRANISFVAGLLGWLVSLSIFAIGFMQGNAGAEPTPALGLLFIILLLISFLLYVLAIVFGGMSMGKSNTENRWKGILGLVLGILGICSILCCFVVGILALAVGFQANQL